MIMLKIVLAAALALCVHASTIDEVLKQLEAVKSFSGVSISPDGRWLAYSGFQSGNWNLFLREFRTGEVRRLTTAPCNQIEPAWLGDSKTLLYGSDCGRALWFTAICRRRVL